MRSELLKIVGRLKNAINLLEELSHDADANWVKSDPSTVAYLIQHGSVEQQEWGARFMEALDKSHAYNN